LHNDEEQLTASPGDWRIPPPAVRPGVTGVKGVAGLMAVAGLALVQALLAPSVWASDQTGFWDQAATGTAERRFEQLVRQADELLAQDRAPASGASTRAEAALIAQRQRATKTEALLREALTLRSDDFRLTLALADTQMALAHFDDAAQTVRRALTLAELSAQQALGWSRLSLAYMKSGHYAASIAATDRLLTLGPTDGATYANVAELLMAVGRLPEAEDRYREAIRADSEAADRRLREHSLALGYYGLGVALDRDGQPTAAREMIARALALDPGMALLQLAQQPSSDVSFVPTGDVHYYLGLANLVAGRSAESEEAFRAFLAAQPDSRWAEEARGHLAVLEAQRKRRGSHNGYRVVATATVHASGPVPAPMVDAAWRRRPDLIDGCLSRLPLTPARPPIRLIVDVEIDARGNLTRASIPRPTDVDTNFATCVEEKLKSGFIIPAAPTPTRARSTLARLELLLAD
jgi:tetratricopeptide (TPR) repeat protein